MTNDYLLLMVYFVGLSTISSVYCMEYGLYYILSLQPHFHQLIQNFQVLNSKKTQDASLC
jgi:hypothetical protein